jgi:hypothetical protein
VSAACSIWTDWNTMVPEGKCATYRS